jgi:hypothetical protein
MTISSLVVALMVAGVGDRALVRPQPGMLVRSPEFSGRLIPEDAGTICHPYWDGSQIRDTKGCSWTMTGTVPQVASSGKTPAGAGPFSASNFYTGPTIGLASVGNVCVVANVVSATTSQIIFGAADGTSKGWYFWILSGNVRFAHDTAGTTPSTPISAGLNVICGWSSDGTTYKVRTSLGATGTDGAGTLTASGTGARLGLYQAGTLPFTGTIYEARASSTPASDADVAAIMARIQRRLNATW